MKRNKTEFAILPAFHGDCILIKTFDTDQNEFIIVIDGGTSQTFRHSLKKELESINHIDLLILTHIDSDHIGGLINLFKSSLIDNITIDEIWMNHPEFVEVSDGELISTKQGNNLKDLIFVKRPDVKLTEISTLAKLVVKSGIEFVILSPTPEINIELYRQWQVKNLAEVKKEKVSISSIQDSYFKSLEDLSKIPFSPDKRINDDIFNSSSISFILKCYDISILLLADSRPEIISQSLRSNGYNECSPLEVNYVKVSHHGSLNNTSQELLGLIRSDNFIISTNGGTSSHKHPSRETIARIVFNSQRTDEVLSIYFNHKVDDIKGRIGDFINKDDFNSGNWLVESKNWF